MRSHVISLLLLFACRRETAEPRAKDDWRVEPAAPAVVELTGLTFPLDPPATEPLVAVPAFEKLGFDRPLWLGHAGDQSGRVFVAEQPGRIMVFAGTREVATAEVFLDIRDRVRTEHNEEGLLGVAFAPDYARTGHVYVYYSASRPRRVVISRFTVSSDPNRALPDSEKVMLEVEQPYGNHNGGPLLFGPDGDLYIGLGDGGSAGDPENRAQDLSTLLGKMLRVRIGADGSFTAPPDNPFVGRAGARPEIWAYGLRNPWRCSFDRQLGTLWCGDVGQDSLEEIDIVTKGGNYGWRWMEGTKEYDPPKGGVPSDAKLTAPVHVYPRRDGISVTGGYVYRGTHLPAFRGAYFFGDFGTGNVWTIDHDGAKATGLELVAKVPMLASFGEDEAGELFAVSHEGRIYRFEPAEASGSKPAFPTLLSQTGLFTDTAALAPNPGLVPYDVNVELWSDGAKKTRWLALPSGTTIDFATEGAWTFPVGTAVVKHFELELAAGTMRRLETRVMVHERRGWAGYTYRWNDEQTDAELVTAPREATYRVTRAGVEQDQRWYYPAGSDCLRCHTRAYGEVLGIRTRQLAGRTSATGGGLLAEWIAAGRVKGAPADLATLPSHPATGDTTASEGDRARAYLDVNCAICHLPDGPAPSTMDLRAETPLASMKLVDAVPDAPIGLANERRVHAGNPDASAVIARMSTRGRGAMPPLASTRVHDDAVAMLRTWIESLARP